MLNERVNINNEQGCTMRINAKVHNGEYGGKQVLNETFPLVKGSDSSKTSIA